MLPVWLQESCPYQANQKQAQLSMGVSITLRCHGGTGPPGSIPPVQRCMHMYAKGHGPETWPLLTDHGPDFLPME